MPENLQLEDRFPGISPFISVYDIWLGSPGDPTKLNPKGDAWIVMADSLGGNHTYFPQAQQAGLDRAIREEMEYEDSAFRDKLDTGIQKKGEQKIGPGLTAFDHNIGLTIVSAALGVLGAHQGKEYLSDKQPISRRAVIGAGARVGAALFFSKAFSKGPVRHRQLSEEEAMQVYYDSDASKVPGSDWINARNALYILKTKDALDWLSKNGKLETDDAPPSAAIVAGTGHAVGIKELEGSDENCALAIRKYMSILYGVIDQYCDSVDPSLDRETAKAMLTDQVLRVDMVRFGNNTDTSGDSVLNAAGQIKSRIVDQASFRSSRVAKALQSIES